MEPPEKGAVIGLSPYILKMGGGHEIVDTNGLLDAPTRIKKELNAVLTLQSELDELEKKLSSTRELMNSLHGGSAISDGFMNDLEAQQQQVVEKVKELYVSLNVQDSFPELEGIDIEFLTTLFLARDLKMNIRKRAISSFFEWDKLNQAKGGREVAIGAHFWTGYRFVNSCTVNRNETSPIRLELDVEASPSPSTFHSMIQQALPAPCRPPQASVGSPSPDSAPRRSSPAAARLNAHGGRLV